MIDDSIDSPTEGIMINNTNTYNEIFMLSTLANKKMAIRIKTQWEDYGFGTVDYNKYFVPYYSTQVAFGTATIHGGGGTWEALLYELSVWNSSGGYGYAESWDANSEKDSLGWTSPYGDTHSQCVYNDTSTSSNIPLTGTWYDLDGNMYVGGIILGAFTGKILIDEAP